MDEDRPTPPVSDPRRIAFRVNGEEVAVRVPPEMPLLWVLRDHLQLTGTKYGCGRGLCGACTVHLDGRPLQSCQIPVESIAGSTVTTIEGLSPDGSHSAQTAWEEHSVPQCGYCQVGQIMQLSALLEGDSAITSEVVVGSLNRNLCRCGTYPRIVRAALSAAGLDSESNE